MVEENIEVLPAPGPQSSDDHARISRRFMKHAWEQLDVGNRLQASEKAWGATNHALKAIAVQRGWRHDDRGLAFAIAGQLASEFDRSDFRVSLTTVNGLHSNFYANQQDAEDIRNVLGVVEQFVADLEEVRQSPPRPFTVTTNPEQNRLQNLLGRRVPMNSHSEVGFAKTPRRRNSSSRRSGTSDPDGDNGNGTPAVRPKPNGSPTAGGQANPAPGSAPDVQLRPGKTLNQSDADAGNAGRSGNSGRRNRRRNRENRGGESPEVNIRLD